MLTLPHAIAAILASMSAVLTVVAIVAVIAGQGVYGYERSGYNRTGAVVGVGAAILFAAATIVHFLALVR